MKPVPGWDNEEYDPKVGFTDEAVKAIASWAEKRPQKEYGLSDRIYTDSLSAIAAFAKDYLIVGGAAATLNVYGRCDEKLLRKTDDIDILLCPQPTKSDLMWNYGTDMVDNLRQKGYLVEIGKPKSTFEISVYYPEDTIKENPFFLHFSRNSKKYLNIHEKRLKNQIEHGVERPIPQTNQMIPVESPEDIILGKLPRRMDKDIHDIALLMKCVPIDQKYMEDAAGLWYHDPKVVDDMMGLFDKLYEPYKK